MNPSLPEPGARGDGPSVLSIARAARILAALGLPLLSSGPAQAQTSPPLELLELHPPHSAPGDFFGASMAAGEGRVAVGGVNAVHVYDADTGEHRWSAHGTGATSFGTHELAIGAGKLYVAEHDHEPAPGDGLPDGRVRRFLLGTGVELSPIEKPQVYSDYDAGGGLVPLPDPEGWGRFSWSLSFDPVGGRLYTSMYGKGTEPGSGALVKGAIAHRFDPFGGDPLELGWLRPGEHELRVAAHGSLLALMGDGYFVVAQQSSPTAEPQIILGSGAPYAITPEKTTLAMAGDRLVLANSEIGPMRFTVPTRPYPEEGQSMVFSHLVPGGTGADLSYTTLPYAQYPDVLGELTLAGGGWSTRNAQFSIVGHHLGLIGTIALGDPAPDGLQGSPAVPKWIDEDLAAVGWPQATRQEGADALPDAGRAFISPLYSVVFARADGLYRIDTELPEPALVVQDLPADGGRVFIDTDRAGAFNGATDTQSLEVEVEVTGKLTQQSAGDYSIRWELLDPDDPASVPEIDAEQDGLPTGGDNTGNPHEGADTWLLAAQHGDPVDRESGPAPDGNGDYPDTAFGPDREVLLESARTPLEWNHSTQSWNTSVTLRLGDDGGDDYVLRAVLVRGAGGAAPRDVAAARTERISVWRHRTLFEYRQGQEFLGTYRGAWDRETLSGIYSGGPLGDPDPNECPYVHFERVLETRGLYWDGTFGETTLCGTLPDVDPAAVHRFFQEATHQPGIVPFDELPGHLAICVVDRILGTVQGASFPWHSLVRAKQLQVSDRSVIDGLHEIGHLLLTDGPAPCGGGQVDPGQGPEQYCNADCFHLEHTALEACLFRQGEHVMELCSNHIVLMRRNCVRDHADPLDATHALYDSDPE